MNFDIITNIIESQNGSTTVLNLFKFWILNIDLIFNSNASKNSWWSKNSTECRINNIGNIYDFVSLWCNKKDPLKRIK